MSGKVVRAQEVITITADTKQDKRDAVDVGAYTQVIVQVNRLVGTGGTIAKLVIEHSATLEENQFEPLTAQAVLLTVAGPISVSLPLYTRWVRWTVINMAGLTATFSVDLVMRD